MAATSSGCNETSPTQTSELPYPPAGTIFDQMSANGITWANYYTDLPAFIIIPQNIEKHPTNVLPVADFFAACEAGTLPNVSIVEPEYGAASDVGAGLNAILQAIPSSSLPASLQATQSALGGTAAGAGGSEEQPQDIAIGEQFAAKVINAAMASPQWKSMLIIWTYDEHGGYYDHVPPAAAVLPDNIPPILQSGDPAGAFNTSGVRVPFVVASPYSKPNAVSNVPHDHTAMLATIEAKWNLPALTHRDAQSATLFDYLDFTTAHFATPPTLAAPANPASVNGTCSGTPPPQVVSPDVTRKSKALEPTRR
jgi:phospholipase C